MKLLKFPELDKKDLEKVSNEITELLYAQKFDLNIVEVMGILELVKIKMLDALTEWVDD